MARYDVPDPKCNHAQHLTRVSSHHDIVSAKGASASVWVCDREACIEDARAWVFARTGRQAIVVPR